MNFKMIIDLHALNVNIQAETMD